MRQRATYVDGKILELCHESCVDDLSHQYRVDKP